MDIKWSAFPSGGALQPTDQIVGLRSGANERFTVSNIPNIPGIQGQKYNYAVDSGTTNAYVINLTPAIISYEDGQLFNFRAAHGNTGASTINVNGVGVIPLVNNGNVALQGTEIVVDGDYLAIYNAAYNAAILINGLPIDVPGISNYDLWVSPNGSDSGNGTVVNPFKTIAHAMSVGVQSPSNLQPYNIILTGGQFDEVVQIELKYYVSIFSFSGTAVINNSLPIILNVATISGTPNDTHYLNNITVLGSISLDYNSIPTATNSIVYINNCKLTGTINLLGNSSTNSFRVKNCEINDFYIDNATLYSNNNNYINSYNGGTIVTTTNQSCFHFSDIFGVITTFNGANSGAITNKYYIYSSILPASYSLNNSKTTLLIDVDSYVAPTITSGAIVSLLSISNGLNANYSPVNYTPLVTPPDLVNSMHAHLRGIDAALAGVSPTPYVFVYRYVTSTGGVDAVGNGSITDPYATISYAISQITDNSITKRYIILCYGNLTETTLSLKPWVLIQGNSSSLAITTINLDASFVGSTNALCYIDNFTGLNGALTLDFTGAIAPRIIVTNLRPSTPVTWTITGPTVSSGMSGVISRNFGGIGFTTPINLSISNFDGEIIDNCFSTVNLTTTGSSTLHSIFFGNNIIVFGGSLTVSSTSGSNINVSSNSFFQSVPLSLTNTSTGTAVLNCIGADGFSSITITGALTTFSPDLISVTPTFASGASDGVNLIYSTLAASITAGFSPTNYTVANTRTKAHLQGIDTKLGVISPATNSFVYRYVSSTNGVDAVGNGSILKPYATISYALSQITDATVTKQYFLVCYGIFTETNLALKPFISLEGNGSKLSVSGTLSQSSDWASLSNGYIVFNNFEIAIASVTFQIASTTGGKVIFSNLYNTLTSSWLFQANDTMELILNNIGNPDFTSSNIIFTIYNFLATKITNCYLNQLVLFANFYGNQNYYTSGNVILGAYEINAENGLSGNFYVDDTFISGAILGISAPDSGLANVRVKSAAQITDIRLDGANVNFIPDLLSVIPTFSGGASASNITYISLAESIIAGFSPANYTVADSRVEAHLQGIDAKLGTGTINWTEVTTTTQAAAVNNGYVANNAGLVTITLPATAAQFSVVSVVGKGAGGFKVVANTGQIINVDNVATSTAGSVSSTNRWDGITLRCVTANTTWSATSVVGNFDVI